MIKTLRITSILVALLSVGLLVFPAVFGFRSNKKVEEFLNLQSMVAKFRNAQRDRGRPTDQVSPLVAQAGLFGAYLRPPAPKERRKTTVVKGVPGKETIEIKLPEKPKHSLKFTVIATSFYAARPEQSLALVDEPGAGRYWVRPGDVVSSLTIDEIKDGVVVARGGNKVFEQPVLPRPPQRSLDGSPSPVSKGTSDGTGPETVALSTGTMSPGQKRMSEDERTAEGERLLQEMLEMALAAEGRNESGETDSGVKAVEDVVSEAEAMRISGTEAKNLGRLGQQLKNQDPNRPKSKKTDKSTAPSKAKKPIRSKPKGRPSSSGGSGAKKGR